MKTKQLILTLLFAGILTTAFTCKSPTETEDKPNNDTTSHNFIWRVDTLGSTFSSARCVEIVNDTNIWVGGEFTGTKPDGSYDPDVTYNLAHWNGTKWSYEKIMFLGAAGPSDLTPQPIISIKIFDNKHVIILSSYNSLAFWNGNSWTTKYPSGSGDKQRMWARSENDIYFVGTGGSIVHYNGTSFTKMNSGTTADLNDIWGDEDEVFVTGMGFGKTQVALLHYQNNKWNKILDYDFTDENANPDLGGLYSIYKGQNIYMLGGEVKGSIYRIKSFSSFSYEVFLNINDFPVYFAPALIRGIAESDLFAFSAVEGDFLHYNGSSWKFIQTPQVGLHLFGVCIKEKTIVIVGGTGFVSSSLVKMGKHL